MFISDRAECGFLKHRHTRVALILCQQEKGFYNSKAQVNYAYGPSISIG